MNVRQVVSRDAIPSVDDPVFGQRYEGEADADSESRLPMLGLAGALSLCCVFAAPAGTAAVSGTTAGSTTAALGGGVVQIFVAAVTVAVLAFVFRLRRESSE